MSCELNRPQSRKKRRYLRQNLTTSEKLLWAKIRKRQLKGLRFRRQYGVMNYVVDFYCPAYKLAIEIVGDVHGYNSRKRFDEARSKRIESLGIKILTYTNVQIQQEIAGVLDDIVSNLPLTPSFIRRGNRPTSSKSR